MTKIPPHLEEYFTQQMLALLEPDRANTWQVINKHVHVYDEDGWLHVSNEPITKPLFSQLGILLTVNGFIHAKDPCAATHRW